MTGILGAGAFSALKAVRSANAELAAATRQMATGKSVATAADNAAVWSVSATMDSDVSGLKGVIDGIAHGAINVAFAQTAAENATALLRQLKERVTLAQADGVDRTKINADVQALKRQIRQARDGAAFNGFNLMKHGAPATMTVPTSLVRDETGAAVATVEVERPFAFIQQPSPLIPHYTLNAGRSDLYLGQPQIYIDLSILAEGDIVYIQLGSDGPPDDVPDTATLIEVTVTAEHLTYTPAGRDAFVADVLAQLSGTEPFTLTGATPLSFTPEWMPALLYSGPPVDVRYDFIRPAWQLPLPPIDPLQALWSMGVGDAGSAAQALADIDPLIDLMTGAAAYFGTMARRLEGASSAARNLIGAMDAGVGALVDADMEEVAARRVAAELRLSLAQQSLGIANARPQLLLSLFGAGGR